MNALVTGAAGTVGSEFCRQLLGKGYSVTAVDNSEWALVALPEHEMLTKRLMDFRHCYGSYDLLVHCAAYKHVDLIEENQVAATINNVSGTKDLYAGVNAPILFISTDKAVEPSSHYGRTKEEGERLTREAAGIVSRMGNIIGSSGSVIPKWEACIEKGEPLPVTDLSMTRYMLPVDEAVASILDLYAHATPGDTLIPAMDDPVSLGYLVELVLSRHGLTARGEKAYPIDIIGIRPGEKLHEKLSWDWENTVFSNSSGIIVRR